MTQLFSHRRIFSNHQQYGHNKFTLRWIFILKTFGQHLRPQFRTVICQSQGILILFKLAPITHGKETLDAFSPLKNHLNLWIKTHDELRKYLKSSSSRRDLNCCDWDPACFNLPKKGSGAEKDDTSHSLTVFFMATWPREGAKEQSQKTNPCDSPWFCFFGFSLVYIYIHHTSCIIKRSNSWYPS